MAGSIEDSYEIVIGLEVHAQLLTKSKLFSGDAAAYGAMPNTHVSPIALAHPGTLPAINRQAVALAVKLGLAMNCTIEKNNYFARKNYFYPDLPKGYQVTQHTNPICIGGHLNISLNNLIESIQLNRIHLEEDAGKSLHEIAQDYTCIDLNRAGVPLVEIVTEPVLHSSEQAYAFLTELRKLVRYLDVCDGNMEEGSMRCDANISVRKKGSSILGTKVEVKNLNSIRNVKKAIEFEAARLIQLEIAGQPILPETRSYDADNDSTFSLRSKEEANDYRYFPEPDLAPFHITDTYIEIIRQSMPMLPEAIKNHFIETYQLSEYDALFLSDEKERATYFEATVKCLPEAQHYKAITNWMIGPIQSSLNTVNKQFKELTLLPAQLAELVLLVAAGKVNFSTAQQELLPDLLLDPNTSAEVLAQTKNLIQEANTDILDKWIEAVLQEMPDKVEAYKKGKKGLLGVFVGEVKKKSNGKADPKRTNELLIKYLTK